MAETISIDSILSGEVLVGPRFELQVSRGSGCWEWTGAVTAQGYARYWQDGRYHPGHRISYQFVYGPIPRGLYACHHCDNRKCVRPDHIFVGTATDNNRDMWAKGRGVANGPSMPGEQHPRAVLTERDVLLIRRLVVVGVPQIKVAEAFEVSFGTISDIARGKRWKHVGQ